MAKISDDLPAWLVNIFALQSLYWRPCRVGDNDAGYRSKCVLCGKEISDYAGPKRGTHRTVADYIQFASEDAEHGCSQRFMVEVIAL